MQLMSVHKSFDRSSFFLSHTLIKYCDSEIRVPKLHFTTHKKSEFRQELNNKKHTTVQFEMKNGFLTICLFGITGLTCNCSVVHRHSESDTKQPDEIDLDRSARDLIGFNRQRNTAFQTRLKLFEKKKNRQQKISDFGIKLDPKTIKRYHKLLAAYHKRRRNMKAKELGY